MTSFLEVSFRKTPSGMADGMYIVIRYGNIPQKIRLWLEKSSRYLIVIITNCQHVSISGLHGMQTAQLMRNRLGIAAAYEKGALQKLLLTFIARNYLPKHTFYLLNQDAVFKYFLSECLYLDKGI